MTHEYSSITTTTTTIERRWVKTLQQPNYLQLTLNSIHVINKCYFFLLDALVEVLVDCWEAARGVRLPDRWELEAWVAGRLATLLLLTGLSVGVCASLAADKALARDADRSRARIFSSACFSSPSA